MEKREKKEAQKKAEKDQDKKQIGGVDGRFLYIGDDTGLLKKVKMTVNIEKDIISEPSKRPFKKRTLEMMEQGEAEEEKGEEWKEEAVIRNRADINFKVVNKYGKQVKDEGISHMCWTLGENNNDYVSYVRGKSNVVQVFDTQTEQVFQQKTYNNLSPIQGIAVLGNDIFKSKYAIIDEKGKLIVDSLQNKTAKFSIEIETKSQKVSFMKQNPFDQNEMIVGSKDSLLMLWDISKQTDKFKWQARNLPNDELDLQIPIFDKDGCYLDKNRFALVTAYGDVREYDIRGQRRPMINTKVSKGDDMLLNRITKSKSNDNQVIVSNQEGHVYVLDKRKSYATVKKLIGNKGSVRALTSFVCQSDNQEYVVSAGCDRHVRIFNINCDYQKDSEVSHCYLKQKLNSILISKSSNQ